jgi:hypothetical protein
VRREGKEREPKRGRREGNNVRRREDKERGMKRGG